VFVHSPSSLSLMPSTQQAKAMAFLMVTRFSKATWQENVDYRAKHSYPGCVYGTPRLIADYVEPDAPLIVLEMNLTTRKIEGAGLIRNRVSKKRARVYSNGDYNRFTYNTRYRLDKRDFPRDVRKIVGVVEKLIFYGKRHVTRGHGITRLPLYIQKHENLAAGSTLLNAFRRRFPDAPLDTAGWPQLIPDDPALLAARGAADRPTTATEREQEQNSSSL